MQKLIIEDGIKTSLAALITREQDIFEGNYIELIGTFYNQGLFINKDSSGNLENDFAPTITNDDVGNPTLLEIGIRGNNPAKAYVGSGKVLSLNSSYVFAPLSFSTATVTSTTASIEESVALPAVATSYDLYVVPAEIEREPQDYLPNYISEGETKNLVKDYVIDFLTVNPSESTQVTIDGIKLCSFTVNPDGTLTDLVDNRLNVRAYIKPELYDFFIASYLKHDFILTHAEYGSTNDYVYFTDDYKLTGSFTLLGGKTKTAKITVEADEVIIPVNSVLFITVSENDFFGTSTLVKTLETTLIADFVPTQDKVVLGYHLKTNVPTTSEPEIVQTPQI